MSAVSTPTPAILDVLPDARAGPATAAAPAIRDNLPDVPASSSALAAPVVPAATAAAPAEPVEPAATAAAPAVRDNLPGTQVAPASAAAEPAAAATATAASAPVEVSPSANSIPVFKIIIGGKTAEMRSLTMRHLLTTASEYADQCCEQIAKGYARIALLVESKRIWVSKGYNCYATLSEGVRRIDNGVQVATADEVARAIEAQHTRDAQKRAEAAAQKVAASAEKIAAAVATIVAEAANLPPVAAADADAAMMAAWRGLVRDKAGPSRGTAVAALEAAVLVARAEPRA